MRKKDGVGVGKRGWVMGEGKGDGFKGGKLGEG